MNSMQINWDSHVRTNFSEIFNKQSSTIIIILFYFTNVMNSPTLQVQAMFSFTLPTRGLQCTKLTTNEP